MQASYGPNHEAVQLFLDGLPSVRWFSSVGKPASEDATLVRVGLDELLAAHADPYCLWGGLLAEREASIDQTILSAGRLGADIAVQTKAVVQGGGGR